MTEKYEPTQLGGYRYVVRAVLWLIYLAVVVGLIIWWVNT
jgi:hypothetical protein